MQKILWTTSLLVTAGTLAILWWFHEETRMAELQTRMEILRVETQAAQIHFRNNIHSRALFLEKDFPLPRQKDSIYTEQLHQLQRVSLQDHKDFELMERLESMVSSRVAEDISRELKSVDPKKQPTLSEWIRRLQGMDRRLEESRQSYLHSAALWHQLLLNERHTSLKNSSNEEQLFPLPPSGAK